MRAPYLSSGDLEQATTLIVERAKQLVNQLIEDRGHDKPPFLPKEFARLQGVERILKADLGRLSAVLLRFEDGYVIKVNENHHTVRQNFSCAHEIGHILFSELQLERYIEGYIENIEYRTFNPQVRDKAHEKAKERLCDIAATEILMPEPIFRKYLSSFGVSVYSIERLAHVFGVSFQAAAIRIAEVGTEPCIALLWHSLKRAKSKSLRLAWRVGPGRKLRGKGYYMPLHTHVRYPSTFHKAYQCDSAVKCHKIFKLDSTTKRLPVESKGFGYGEMRYVISLAFPNR